MVILLQRFLIALLKVESQAQEVVRPGIQVRQSRWSDQGMSLVDRGELRPSKSHDLRIVPEEEVLPPIDDTFTQGPAQCFPFDQRDTCAVELGEVADHGGNPQFEELATRKERQVCSICLFWLEQDAQYLPLGIRCSLDRVRRQHISAITKQFLI